MKTKNYKQKRKDLKIEKRQISKTSFENTNIRKARVNDIKRKYRSLKRSERQVIKKQIKDNVDGIDYPLYFQEPNDGKN
jgi:hypothetical protein